jgi:hypothetical protein
MAISGMNGVFIIIASLKHFRFPALYNSSMNNYRRSNSMASIVADNITNSEKQAKQAAINKAQALAPHISINVGSTPATKFRGNPDIFGRLVEDHDTHRALFAMIEQTEGKSPERIKLFRELNKEVQAHAAAEEQALWSTIIRNPETTPVARHAIAEHHELDVMFADLAARDMSSSAWLVKFAALKEEYLHHIREEEQEQFEAAEGALTSSDLRYMHKVFNRRKVAEKAAAKIEKKIKIKD